jgi:hypothetical protein
MPDCKRKGCPHQVHMGYDVCPKHAEARANDANRKKRVRDEDQDEEQAQQDILDAFRHGVKGKFGTPPTPKMLQTANQYEQRFAASKRQRAMAYKFVGFSSASSATDNLEIDRKIDHTAADGAHTVTTERVRQASEQQNRLARNEEDMFLEEKDEEYFGQTHGQRIDNDERNKLRALEMKRDQDKMDILQRTDQAKDKTFVAEQFRWIGFDYWRAYHQGDNMLGPHLLEKQPSEIEPHHPEIFINVAPDPVWLRLYANSVDDKKYVLPQLMQVTGYEFMVTSPSEYQESGAGYQFSVTPSQCNRAGKDELEKKFLLTTYAQPWEVKQNWVKCNFRWPDETELNDVWVPDLLMRTYTPYIAQVDKMCLSKITEIYETSKTLIQEGSQLARCPGLLM